MELVGDPVATRRTRRADTKGRRPRGCCYTYEVHRTGKTETIKRMMGKLDMGAIQLAMTNVMFGPRDKTKDGHATK